MIKDEIARGMKMISAREFIRRTLADQRTLKFENIQRWMKAHFKFLVDDGNILIAFLVRGD